MEIRPARSRDIPGMIALLKQVGEVHHVIRPDIFRSGAQKYNEADLETLLKDDARPIFVAVEGEFVQGYCFCVHKDVAGSTVLTDRKELYIDDLCVDENCRGQHVGKALYDYVLDFARHSGCHNITLNVWSCNPGAMKFYEKCGLKPQKICMEQIL